MMGCKKKSFPIGVFSNYFVYKSYGRKIYDFKFGVY
jgi:hypothetical protein